MALDFLIGILLFISAIVNVLALGAFWVTPSLRTTSNRFIINLLTANLVSCIILAPSFLLNATSSSKDIFSLHHEEKEFQETINATTKSRFSIETDTRCKNTTSAECNPESVETIVNMTRTEDRVKDIKTEKTIDSFEEVRFWGLDLAAALGSLSVLLVVGDTWCAVTDPLRYHSRISSLKAWIFIVVTWIIGIFFGVGSAFRKKQVISDVTQNVLTEDYTDGRPMTVINITTTHAFMKPFTMTENVYTTVYTVSYFVIVILLPFCFVCGMYWRIFSEARGNGLRMRQNGSSPLLQSALNLATSTAAPLPTLQPIQQVSHPAASNNHGGLTLKIDKPLMASGQTHNNNNSFQVNNKNHRNRLEIPPMPHSDNNQNVLLTLTSETPVSNPGSLEQLRRNHSARQLFLLDDNQPQPRSEMRHVHSTPNLQKLMTTESSTSNTLPAPSINVPPKALSYMTSIRHRLSNASSLFKYREESRAARISILVVIMFLISYLPYGILVVIQGHVNFVSPYHQALIAIFTVVTANISSPFIFAYRNKRVVRGVKRLLGLEKRSNDRFHHHQGTYKTTVAKVKRSCSKASAYSVNTNRYLTPNSALKGTFVLEIEKCTDDEDSSYEEGKSFLKRICDSSRKWDCTGDSCAGKNDTEQTDV